MFFKSLPPRLRFMEVVNGRNELSVDIRLGAIAWIRFVEFHTLVAYVGESLLQPGFSQQPECNELLPLCEKRGGRRITSDFLRMPEVIEVMALAATDGEDHGIRTPTPAGSSNSLLTVESLRRHIRLKRRLERANIDTNFHRGRDRESVDLVCPLLNRVERVIVFRKQYSSEAPLPVSRVVSLPCQFIAFQTKTIIAALNSLRQETRASEFLDGAACRHTQRLEAPGTSPRSPM